jgi:probable addiction module antidote protein
LHGIVSYLARDGKCQVFSGNALDHAAFGVVARAKGMTDLAKEAGLERESLYKSLSSDGNPSFATVIKVLNALGVKLHATSADA